MKYLLGTKQNMTQIFDENGRVHPATCIKVGDLTVSSVKTKKSDGYEAVQLALGSRSLKRITKPLKGHLAKAGLESAAFMKEFRLEGEPLEKIGDKIDLATFAVGDKVTVSSISKGKGFQGVVKRHGFKGGPRTHGQKHSEREPGSIGGGGRDGGRVAKGKRMAGRMGGDRITSKGLTVVAVNPSTREIFIRGAVAGRRGTLVEIKG